MDRAAPGARSEADELKRQAAAIKQEARSELEHARQSLCRSRWLCRS
eukprot:SAG11_NODE_34881_length_269_cov_1.270588_1_plen_46_part_01